MALMLSGLVLVSLSPLFWYGLSKVDPGVGALVFVLLGLGTFFGGIAMVLKGARTFFLSEITAELKKLNARE